MVEVKVDPDKPFETALRQFKKKVELSGITAEMRKREHYEKPSVRRKLKSLAARKNQRRKASREM
jgi:small subunit ribosomal protein S21